MNKTDYNLSKDLWRRLKYLVSASHHAIHNAQQFLQRSENVEFTENEIMVSFDVTSLFTSVDIHAAKATVAELLENNLIQNGTLEK